MRLVHRNERNLDGALLPSAHDGQFDGRSDSLLLEDMGHVVQGLDSLTVDRDDRVAEEDLAASSSPEAFEAGSGRGLPGTTSCTNTPSSWLRSAIDSGRAAIPMPGTTGRRRAIRCGTSRFTTSTGMAKPIPADAPLGL